MWGVSAAGKTGAWAVGEYGKDSGASWPVAARWLRGAWHPTALPSKLTSYLFAVSADSSTDAWAVSGQGGYVLHWSRGRWSVAKSWPESGLPQELTGVTAFSPTDVWVFGGSGAYPGEGTWHLHGSTWTKATGLGGNISFASAVSRSNMWAVGGITVGQDAIIHYLNGRWHHATAPALKGLGFNGITAVSSRNVWAAAEQQTAVGKAFLVHLARHGWTRIRLPWRVDLTGIAQDGHGGFWLSALSMTAHGGAWLIHRSASGAWSRTRASGGTVFSLATIPRSGTVLGAGAVTTKPAETAAIWANGRLP